MKENDYEDIIIGGQGHQRQIEDDDLFSFERPKNAVKQEDPDELKELSYYVDQIRDPGAGKKNKKDMNEILKAFDAIEAVKQRVGKRTITNAERYELIELYEKALSTIDTYRSDTPKTELSGAKLRDFEKAQLMLRGELCALYESGRDNLPNVYQLWLRGANTAEKAIREHGFEYMERFFSNIIDKYEDKRLVAMNELDKEISQQKGKFRVNEQFAEYEERKQALKNQEKEPEKEDIKLEEDEDGKLEDDGEKEEQKEEQKEVEKKDEKEVEQKEEKEVEKKDEKEVEKKDEKKDEKEEEKKEEKIEKEKDKEEKIIDINEEEIDEKNEEIKEEIKEKIKEEKKEERVEKPDEEGIGSGKEEKETEGWGNLENEDVSGLGFGEKAPKENLREVYEEHMFDSGRMVAGTALYGMLGDVLTQEQKDAIFGKMSFIYLAEHGNNGLGDVYGDEYAEIAERLANNEVKEQAVDEPRRNDLHNSHYYKYADPAMEKPIALFKEGMKDLLDAMDKKSSAGRFNTPEEENVFYLMKGFVEDMYDGTFTEKFRNDPQYEFAHSILTKIKLTAPSVTLKKNGDDLTVTAEFAEQIDDSRNIKILAGLGIPDVIAGAVKTARMADEHLTTGDTTRDDLLNEYRLQLQRAQKYCSMTKAQFDAVQDKYKVFDNVYEEFAPDGNRGFGYIINDLNAKIDFVKAGYPVSDLPALSGFIRVLSGYEFQKADEEKNLHELETKENPNQHDIDNSKELIKKYESRIALYKHLWKEAADGPVTEADRLRNLKSIKDAIERNEPESATRNQYSQTAVYRLNERINEPVNAIDKALMTDNVMTMYKLLDKADPMLMKSSKEFSKMKSALKTLAEYQETFDRHDEEDITYYSALHKDALEAVSGYLKYKTAQMNDPRNHHKRSQTEARRVKLADAIFNSLRSQHFPGKEEPVSKIEYNAVQSSGGSKRFMRPAATDKLPRDYESYIQMHMGRGIVNADKTVMADCLAKVMAAYSLMNAKEPKPFDLDNVRRCAAELNKKYNFGNVHETYLKEWLDDPDKLKETVRKINQMSFGLRKPALYDDYRSRMRRLYKVLPEPGHDNKYRRFFEAVKKAAHLPRRAHNTDIIKLEDQLANINFDLVNAAKALIKGKEGTYTISNYDIENEPHTYAMDALVDLSDLMGDVCGNVNDIVEDTNRKRGTMDSSYAERYLEKEDFGYERYKKHDKLRELDENLKEETRRSCSTLKTVADNIKEINKDEVKKPGKEHDVRGKLKLDEPDKVKVSKDAPVKASKL